MNFVFAVSITHLEKSSYTTNEIFRQSYAASRAFVYTNAIFALQNACWAVPNPPHSAPFRCRLRVFSKRFYLYKVEFQDSCALQF